MLWGGLNSCTLWNDNIAFDFQQIYFYLVHWRPGEAASFMRCCSKKSGLLLKHKPVPSKISRQSNHAPPKPRVPRPMYLRPIARDPRGAAALRDAKGAVPVALPKRLSKVTFMMHACRQQKSRNSHTKCGKQCVHQVLTFGR